ncbi:MAG: hypothetical protein HY694_10745 [Deltaproteobacteria bacterium]|nr:hypothetical protein [Deltaproteobacteria bacterium]
MSANGERKARALGINHVVLEVSAKDSSKAAKQKSMVCQHLENISCAASARKCSPARLR